MPKIPIFQTQARPTAEIGSIKSNIQIPLSNTIGSALEPLTDFIVKKAVQENDTQNRTEALKLENEFIMEMQKVNETIVNDPVYGINKEAANAYYKEQSNNLLTKYKSQATNAASATLFNNNALGEIQKGIFRNESKINQNILVQLDNQVTLKERSLLTQAIIGPNSNFDFSVLNSDLKKLYTDAYSGKIPAPQLNKIIQNIPSLVQGFTADRDISNNTRLAFAELNKGEKSEFYPDLRLEQRQKLIAKAKSILIPEVKKELDNAIYSLKFEGRSKEVNLDFSKSVLNTEQFNDFQTKYNLAKLNASSVRELLQAPNSDISSIIAEKKYTEIDYSGKEDLTTQQALLTGLQEAAAYRSKEMRSNAVGFITKTNFKMQELKNNFTTAIDDKERIQNRQIYNDAIIAEQIRMGQDRSKIRVTDKTEITSIKMALLNAGTKYEEKAKFIESLRILYGEDNMSMIANHLQDEGLSASAMMGMVSDNSEFSKDLFDSSTLEELTKLATQKLPEATTVNSIQKLIAEKTQSYQNVIFSQGEGSASQAAFVLRSNEALLKVALLRINQGKTPQEAIDSASSDFLNQYVIAPSETFMFPVRMGRKDVPVAAVLNKADAIILGLKDDSEGNQLDKFMGKSGYKHYATLAGVKDLTEAEIKKRITFTIRNHSRWINNNDMSGAVLHANFANGLQPVINADGQKMEFLFVDQENQDPKILSTEFKYPVTFDLIPVIPAIDNYGEIKLND
tara:strand:+ start:119 stop:2332 length:2214 start_codon:yes stop_codon:yes gene_type:complete